MARDCQVNRDPNASPPPPGPPGALSKGGFDSEYASLMAELGEGGKGPGGDSGRGPWGNTGAGHDITAGGSNIPPWRRPEMWQSNQTQNTGYRPPQAYGSGYGAQYASGQWPAAAGAGGYASGTYGQQSDYSASYAQYYQQQYAQQQISTPTQ